MHTLLIGIGATVTMDLWAALLRRLGVPSLDFGMLGRWIGHLPDGQLVHRRIAAAPPVRGERILGWCAHYAIGLTFAALMVTLFGTRPTLSQALAVGLVTVIAPLFILQPALGVGILSSKTPHPVLNSMKSVVTHTIFGLGLFMSSRLLVGVVGG